MAAILGPDPRQSAVDTAESVKITINGAPVGPEWLERLFEVEVRDNLLLPDSAVVRFRDPNGDHLSSNPLKLGAALQIGFGSGPDNATETVFVGEIVALEPEFRQHEAILAARAFDKGHRLNRTKRSDTYINKKAEDIVKQLAGRNGLTVGTVDFTSTVHAHLQQSEQTDWDFCWKLAHMNGFEFAVTEGKVVFRKRKSSGPEATLKWLDSLRSFRPRASVVGQVSSVAVHSHDPKARQPTTGSASSAASASTSPPAIWHQRRSAISAVGGGKVELGSRVATSSGEADAMAKGALSRNASAFVEAEGVALGSPKLRAGATVKIENVGDFSGEYVLSSTVHSFRGGTGYITRFEITGDRSRSFAELVGARPSGGGRGGGGAGGGGSSFGNQLVIAVVTNNNDPDGMGRVRVKFPQLGDNMESEWARVATLNAGKERGIFMLPQPNDEVVVGFEHGDTRRPFVLGSLYTGREKLPADLQDPSSKHEAKFGVKTNHAFLAHSTKELKLHTGEQMTVEVKREAQGATADFKLDADGNVQVTAAQSVTIKGSSSVTVEAQGGLSLKGANVDIQGTGAVNIKGASLNIG